MHDGGAPPTAQSALMLSPSLVSALLSPPLAPSPPSISFPLSAIPALLSVCLPVCLVFSLSPMRWGMLCAAIAHCLLNLFSFSVQICGHAKAGWEGHVT